MIPDVLPNIFCVKSRTDYNFVYEPEREAYTVVIVVLSCRRRFKLWRRVCLSACVSLGLAKTDALSSPPLHDG